MSQQHCKKTIKIPIPAGATFVDVPYPAGATAQDAENPLILGPAGVGVGSIQPQAAAIRVNLIGSPTAFGTHELSVAFEWHCDEDYHHDWQGGCDPTPEPSDCSTVRSCLVGGTGIDYDESTGTISATGGGTGTCDPFIVNAGTTPSIADDSLGTATLACGETLHFVDPLGLISVVDGSAIVTINHPDGVGDVCDILEQIDALPLDCGTLPVA